MEEQGHKQGRGIGFQLNAVIFIGVAVMVAILISFVGYRAYEELSQPAHALSTTSWKVVRISSCRALRASSSRRRICVRA